MAETDVLIPFPSPSSKSGLEAQHANAPVLAIAPSSNSTTVCQEGNSAGGNIVGRDLVNNFNNVYEAPKPPSPSVRLLKLLEHLRAEVKADNRISTVLDELLRFQEPAPMNTRSLEQKLQAGDRADLIKVAQWSKETFTKKLAKFSFFQSAQEVHSLVLARIWSVYTHQVYPLIKKGTDRIHVEASIQELIVIPLVEELSSPPLRYQDPEVYGMLYFLTGNCYIEWD